MRRTRVIAVLVALLTSVIVSTPAQASPDDWCGSTCDNENPNTFVVHPPGGPAHWYKCSGDAQTVDAIGPNENADLAFWGVTIQLRYSPKCRTVWARAFGLQRSDTLWVKRNPNTSYQDSSFDVEYPYNSDYLNGPNSMWSMMLDDAGQQSVACFTPRAHGTAHHICTRYPY